MALKTLVKVGTITNLSDARYCAGMGVEMLGFTAVEGHATFIDATAYQAIRGWVSGPVFVAEVYGLQRDTISGILENYAPDFLELAPNDLAQLPFDISVPLIIAINNTSSVQEKWIDDWKKKIAYLIIDPINIPEASMAMLAKEFPILLKIENEEKLSLLDKVDAKGVTLNGSQEIRPGLKDYDHLSLVLEHLETVD